MLNTPRDQIDQAHLGPLVGADGNTGVAEISVDDSPVVVVGPLAAGAYTIKWKAASSTDLLYAAQGGSTVGAAHVSVAGEELADKDVVTFNVTNDSNRYVALVTPAGQSGTVRINRKSRVT
jgi:hypothetical protein